MECPSCKKTHNDIPQNRKTQCTLCNLCLSKFLLSPHKICPYCQNFMKYHTNAKNLISPIQAFKEQIRENWHYYCENAKGLTLIFIMLFYIFS